MKVGVFLYAVDSTFDIKPHHVKINYALKIFEELKRKVDT